MASMISATVPGLRSPPAMYEPASTLVQTVGMLEIRPSRSSVDRRGIRTAAVTFIRSVPLRRTISLAQYRRPLRQHVQVFVPRDKVPPRLHRWQGGLQGSEKLRG